jgi:hypothetical protein
MPAKPATTSRLSPRPPDVTARVPTNSVCIEITYVHHSLTRATKPAHLAGTMNFSDAPLPKRLIVWWKH